jgi:hypothetical protein
MMAATTIPTAISAAAPMISMVDPLRAVPAYCRTYFKALVFGAIDRPARGCTNGCRNGDWRLPSVGGYVAGSGSCLNGPGGPMVFAVNTESGIQDIRNLLVFFVARGPFVR